VRLFKVTPDLIAIFTTKGIKKKISSEFKNKGNFQKPITDEET